MYLLMYTLFMSDCNFVKERNNMLENNLKLDMPDKDIIELIKIYLICLIYEKNQLLEFLDLMVIQFNKPQLNITLGST